MLMARISIHGAKNGTLGTFGSQSADARQSPSVASLAFGEASSGYAGQTKTVEKERRGEVRSAHERREREKKPVRLVMKLTPPHASL